MIWLSVRLMSSRLMLFSAMLSACGHGVVPHHGTSAKRAKVMVACMGQPHAPKHSALSTLSKTCSSSG